jgi:hypothetical protein
LNATLFEGGPKLDIIGGESANGIGNEGSDDIPCGFLANTLEGKFDPYPHHIVNSSHFLQNM